MQWAALAATALACAAHANTYLWTAGAANDYWDNNSNWAAFTFPATYPSSGTDDAIISDTSNGDDVQLITVTIDDLTISDDVTFAPKSGTPTLTVDVLTISGEADGTIATNSGSCTIENH